MNGNLLCYLTKVPPGALVSPDLLVMISDIARGMEYLHAKEVVHGDLKVHTDTKDCYPHLNLCSYRLRTFYSARIFGASSLDSA